MKWNERTISAFYEHHVIRSGSHWRPEQEGKVDGGN